MATSCECCRDTGSLELRRTSKVLSNISGEGSVPLCSVDLCMCIV